MILTIEFSRIARLALAALACGALIFSAACGYHMVGTAGNTIPKTVQIIDVPTFHNSTNAFKIEQKLTAAVVRELQTRTQYKIRYSEQPGDADAVLRGTIVGFSSSPVIFDPVQGRATTAQINVRMQVQLIDVKTQKVLYNNQDLVFRDHYEISGQASVYFDESSAAADRLSKSLAATVVAGILSGF